MTADTSTLRQAFAETFGRPPDLTAEAPGRVNLIGEHTDYNGGFVLPVAIDRTVAVAAAARDDGRIAVRSLDLEQCDEFPVDRVRRWVGSRGWRDYVRAVAWALLDSQIDVRGADLAITGDVPQAAGLSSSAAMEVAMAGALTAIAGVEADPARLALACQRAENLFVGVQCGIMDQFAAALGRESHALFVDCRSLDYEYVPLPPGAVIVVVDSKVPRNLADTPYNQRREECAEAARHLGMQSLRDTNIEALEQSRSGMPGALYRRARHVITENARVLAAVEALKAGDIVTFGRLMCESHESLRSDFEVSTPELDLLVDLARDAQGVSGARLTGAGFGGCTVNLVDERHLETFRDAVVEEYGLQTGLQTEFHVCRASDGLWVSHG